MTDIKGVQEYKERIEKLEETIKVICEEWDRAIKLDIETGSASISAAAAITFYKRYPAVWSFGVTLYETVFEDEELNGLADEEL